MHNLKVMQNKTRYGKKTYQALGQMLIKKRPEIAEELLTYCNRTGETDISRIPDFYKKFCEHLQINPLEYIGKLPVEEKLKIRRLFIGVLLKIYNQQIFNLPHTAPVTRLGFAKELSDCLHLSQASISVLIPQVIFEEKTYEEFSLSIQYIVSKIIPGTNGNIKEG